MTKTEQFTLSKGSGNLLRSMKQQLTVDAYVTKGLPKLDAFVRDLRDLLQEYKNAGGGKFDYDHHRSQGRGHEEEGEGRRARSSSRSARRATPSEKAAVAQGFMGLVFKYGEREGRHQVPAARPHRRPRVLDHEQDPRDPRQGRRHQAQDRRPHRPRRDQAHRHEPRAQPAWASPRCRRSSRRTSPSTRSTTST